LEIGLILFNDKYTTLEKISQSLKIIANTAIGISCCYAGGQIGAYIGVCMGPVGVIVGGLVGGLIGGFSSGLIKSLID